MLYVLYLGRLRLVHGQDRLDIAPQKAEPHSGPGHLLQRIICYKSITPNLECRKQGP